MASRAHDLVSRAVPLGPASSRLSDLRRAVRLSLQFLLRRGRAAPREAAAGIHHATGVERLLESAEDSQLPEVLRILEIGLHHEQQHQQLLLTDILHPFPQNPVAPAYAAEWRPPRTLRASGFVALPAGIHRIGFEGAGYSFDNEGPPHAVLLQPASIGQALVTNAQWLDFMADGGYAKGSVWLSHGSATVVPGGWAAARHCVKLARRGVRGQAGRH